MTAPQRSPAPGESFRDRVRSEAVESMVTVSCLDCAASIDVPTTQDRRAQDELLDDYGWQPVKSGGAYCPHHHR